MTAAAKWASRDVDLWQAEVDRHRDARDKIELERAERVLAAAEHQLELCEQGAWPDGDRAARNDGVTKTTPG